MHEQFRFLCLPQNLPTALDDVATRRISRLRHSIVRAQNFNGSFGGKGILEQQVTTSQVVLALSALGDHRDSQRVRRAMHWLSKDKVVNSEYSYWSLAPFNCVDGYDDKVDALFKKANDLAESGLKHHENSPLPNFVSEQARILGRETAFTRTEKSRISKLVNSKTLLQKEAAHVISHTLLVSVVFGECSETLVKSVAELLVEKGEGSGEAIRWSGNIASTCYVLINLIAVKALMETSELDDLIEKSHAAIVYAVDHNEVLSTLPAGGQFQKPQVYTDAVVLRSLVRYWLMRKGWRRVSTTGYDLDVQRKIRLATIFGLGAVATLMSFVAEPLLEVARGFVIVDQNGLPNYWEMLDRFANILGTLGLPGVGLMVFIAGRYLLLRLKNE